MKTEKQNQLILFQNERFRRKWFSNEWFFSVVDIIRILSEISNPNNYWKVLKSRLKKEGSELVTNCNQLKKEDAKNFEKHKKIAKRRGNISKETRLNLEKETKNKIISKNNYLNLNKKKELKK